MNPEQRLIIQKNYSRLTEEILANDIADHLFSKFVIDHDDLQRVHAEETDKDKARRLLDILLDKKEAFEPFLEEVKSHRPDLLRYLTDKVKEQTLKKVFLPQDETADSMDREMMDTSSSRQTPDVAPLDSTRNTDEGTNDETEGASEDAEEGSEDDRSSDNESGGEGSDDDLSSESESELRKKEIRAKLESFRLPAIVGGHTEVYETWKETLSFWLSSGNNEVYMATPFFDLEYLQEFLDIVCEKRKTANIGKIFIRKNCDKDIEKKFHVMLWETIKKYRSEERVFLLQNVFFKAPPMTTKGDYFHAKFIGCINTENEKAEVLLTSANFTSNHFSEFSNERQNYESISYHDMSAEDFKTRFIDPLTMLEEKSLISRT